MIDLPLLIAQETQTVRHVSFLNWDSDAERERSQRGVHFRQSQRLKKRNRKRAKAMERERQEQVWNALTDARNEGPIDDLVLRHPHGIFWAILQPFFRSFRRARNPPLWEQRRPDPERGYLARDILVIFRRSRVTFDDIRQRDSVDLPFLDVLIAMRKPLVSGGVLANPVVSDSSSSDNSSQPSSEGSESDDSNDGHHARGQHQHREEEGGEANDDRRVRRRLE